MSVWLSHVSICTHNAYECAAKLRELTGLGSSDGGWDPSLGKGYRFVPLGSSYLELLTVVDGRRARAADYDLNERVDRAGGDFLASWHLATQTLEELEDIAHRLNAEVSFGKRGRITPDGYEVENYAIVSTARMFSGYVFTYLHWPEPEHFPGWAYPARHRVEPRGLSWIELGGDEQSVRDLIGSEVADSIPIRFVGGESRIAAVGVATSDGDVEVRPGKCSEIASGEMAGGE